MKTLKMLSALYLLALIGCASTVERSHYYSLELPGAQEDQTTGTLGRLVDGFLTSFRSSPATATTSLGKLGIERIRAASYLHHEEFLIRQQDTTELYRDALSFWWSLPADMITEHIYAYLAASRDFQTVSFYPGASKVDYILSGELRRLEFRRYPDHGQAVIALQFWLVDNRTDNIIWRSSTLVQKIDCQWQMEKAARAMGTGLGRILKQMRTQIVQVLQQRVAKEQ